MSGGEATGATTGASGGTKFVFVPLPQYELRSGEGGTAKIILGPKSKLSTFNKQSNTVVKASGFKGYLASAISWLRNIKPDPSFGQKHTAKELRDMSDEESDAMLREAQNVEPFNPYRSG